MDNVELTNDKFQAVTGYSLEEFELITSLKSFDKYKRKFKKDVFQKVLTDNPLLEFSEHLYYFMILACKKQDRIKSDRDNRLTVHQNDLKFKEELLLSLKELLSGGILNISISNIAKSHVIKNGKLKKMLQSDMVISLKEVVRDLGLNSYPLPDAQAIEEINAHIDTEWVKGWMESIGYIDPEYEHFTLDRFNAYFDNLKMSPALSNLKNKLKVNLIEEYASDHPLETPLCIEEINMILERIKPKSGRKQETEDKKLVAYSLSVLTRLDRFLKNTEIETINEIDVTNDDYRYIHNVMAFFNLIIDYRNDPKNEPNLEKRIRKMLKDFHDPSYIEDVDEKIKVLRFHLLNRL